MIFKRIILPILINIIIPSLYDNDKDLEKLGTDNDKLIIINN